MHVFVHRNGGKEMHKITCKASDTIRDLKKKVRDIEGSHPDAQRLCFSILMDLNDDSTLAAYQIQNGDSVCILLRGGVFPSKDEEDEATKGTSEGNEKMDVRRRLRTKTKTSSMVRNKTSETSTKTTSQKAELEMDSADSMESDSSCGGVPRWARSGFGGLTGCARPLSAKRQKVDVTPESNAKAGTGTRQYKVNTMGGATVDVTVPSAGNVADLEMQVASAMRLGFCFSLLVADEKLDQPSASLPDGDDITCVVENPSSLSAAISQKVVNAAPTRWGPEELKKLAKAHLGRCRTVDTFETTLFKEDPYMPDFIREHIEDDIGLEMGIYCVLELEIIDGASTCHKLIGVINEGDSDCNSGYWGPVYLRPSFKQVGGLLSCGDCESEWKISDSSWFNDTDGDSDEYAFGAAFGQEALCGASNARTTLQCRLARAVCAAKMGLRQMHWNF
jgi:hypothetical protein